MKTLEQGVVGGHGERLEAEDRSPSVPKVQIMVWTSGS